MRPNYYTSVVRLCRFFLLHNSPTRLAFGVLTFTEELVPVARGPGSAKEVAGCGLRVAGVPQGSLKDSL